jgi:hypothetical protein
MAATSEDTESVGAWLAGQVEAGDILLLEGELAAGKTTLVRGLVRALGGDADEVSSPTFVLLQTYSVTRRQLTSVHHLDLYRLGDRIRDLREIGIEEVVNDPCGIAAVEWPKDALASWLPSGARVWRVTLRVIDDSRVVTIREP